MASGTTMLVLIDGQMDFAVKDGTYPVRTGALYVPGGEAAMSAAAKFVRGYGTRIGKIKASKDMHPYLHIANNVFWRLKDGSIPPPFTVVSYDAVANRDIVPFAGPLYDWGLKYVRKLEERKREEEASASPFKIKPVLTLWPPHCLTGEVGEALVPELSDAFRAWCQAVHEHIGWIGKGQNWTTEQYGAFEAEVPDPSDPGTQMQITIVQEIEKADVCYWGGIAGDFCLANSMWQAFRNFDASILQKMVILTDCVASISPQTFEEYLKIFRRLGVRIATTADVMA
jgi:nicotinamidase/pyrazinamidase